MNKITKFVLKRPVTTLLGILCLVFFGIMSLTSTKLELTPEINMPMLVVTTVYPGAGPEDIDELVTGPIEEAIGTLSGVDTMTSQSSDNVSMVLMQYEYGTDMDNAYSDLRKKLDLAKSSLPEDAAEPTIIEMDVNQVSSIFLSVNNKGVNNIYNYTEKHIVPELEKLSSVASVDISGGTKEYIRVELIPEKLQQYRLDIGTVASLVGSASFTMPAGSADVGSTKLNLSAGVEYKTPDDLKRIPITAGNGNIIYLEDIANVYRADADAEAIGRYNGSDTVMLGINRNQKYTAVDVSRQTKKAIENMKASDPNLDIVIINDSADQILNSLKTVFSTMIMAIAISTIVLFIFFGDVKGSLIVATSIPISILSAIIMMWAKGYSLNVITLSSIVLGVGMMVDNSIVILESCFRAMEKEPKQSFKNYINAALTGSGTVGQSVLGSTLTTCVVFLPLGILSGLAGQFFQPLGMTIVFCMAASFISAITIVPLCYVYYRPKENPKAYAYKFIRLLQYGYRSLMGKVLRHKKLAIGFTVAMLIASFGLASQLDMVMMPEIDEGTVNITIDMKPDLLVSEQDQKYRQVEAIIGEDTDLENYMLTSSGSRGSITAYLKKDRKKSTNETVRAWRKALQKVDNCDITVEGYSTTGVMNMGQNYSLTLVHSDYDKLKEVTDRIEDELMQDNRVTAVSSSLDNSSPLIKIDIDPVAASAEGFVPAQLAANLNLMLSGKEADNMSVDDKELSVRIEFPKDRYDEISEVESIMLTGNTGSSVLLKDIADIKYEDSPQTIQRVDKQYQASISAEFTELADKTTAMDIRKKYVEPNLINGVEEQENVMLEMMNEEFSNLFKAILIAIFLVFVVMAAQFESPRFSFMVMTTIPFALIGSFTLMWLFDSPISMPVLIGFLMLVGTVVNNGILYVDTVEQYKHSMPLNEAIVEAGATRLRPILMTTLTTVLSMIPMALGFGESGELMQGLALVSVGGLCTSTVLALLVLPVYYYYMNRKKDKKLKSIDTQHMENIEDD